MKKYNCIIVDDEELARQLLENYISRIEFLHLAGKAKNSLEANKLLLQHSVDILLLDIQMPDMTGIDLINILVRKPQIILTTAYQDYAIKGYELNVTDYLLKPIGFDRFLVAINKAVEQITLKSFQNPLQITSNDKGDTKNFILVKSNQKLVKVRFDEIYYIEGMKEYVAFHTKQGRIIGLYSLKQLSYELPAQFLRVHRSYIVNKSFAKAIEGPFIHLENIKLPIGKSFKTLVLNQLFE